MTKRRIYLASSWRNERQPLLCAALRDAGHEVFDFRNPAPGQQGFGWRSIAPNWMDWTPEQFREALSHPVARAGLAVDFNAMRWADTCVALAPFGRSASLELGWSIGAGKPSCVLLAPGEPELMFGLAKLFVTQREVIEWLESLSVIDEEFEAE